MKEIQNMKLISNWFLCSSRERRKRL